MGMDDEHIQRLLNGIKETLNVISEKRDQYDQHIQHNQHKKPHVIDKRKRSILEKQCIFCDKYIIKHDFKEHTESHKAEFSNKCDDFCKFLCAVCEKPLLYERLRDHMKKVHNVNENRKLRNQRAQSIQEKVFHSCKVCDLPILFVRYKVKRHVEQMHKMTYKEYQDKYIEQQEIKKITTIKGFKEEHFKCETCEVLCSSRKFLSQHEEEEHEGLVRFGCRACQFKALRFPVLKTHVSRIHNGTIDLIIEFGKESDTHAEKNKKLKTQSCRICFQIIIGGKVLIAHFKKEHPDERVFKCTECEYGSHWLPNINSHMLGKHEKVGLNCDQCVEA